MILHNRAIFLDRDGTVNEEVSFLTDPAEVRLIPGADEAIREANDLGFLVFIITNQSGVARGLLDESKLQEIHEALLAMLRNRDAHVEAVYYCPHHPDYGEPPYRTTCDCRKPGIGMLAKAAEQHKIDLKQSFLIGDRMADIQTAIAANVHPILVLTGYGKEEKQICDDNGVKPEYIASDILSAISYIRQAVSIESHTVQKKNLSSLA